MVKKSEFIWNIMASIVSSVLNAVLLMFCIRINGTEIAGIFSIAFATASILNAIGDYGIRPYQVTDTNRKYKFGEYNALRIVVVTIMMSLGVIFVIISKYEIEKMLICLFLILYRVIDNLSETYQGEFQIQGRLDIGCKSVVLRNVISIVIFLVINVLTKNIIVSSIAMFCTNLIIFILYDCKKIKKYADSKPIFDKDIVKKLLKECFPVCISTLMSLFLANVIKYAIDIKGTYEMQTYFNIIFLPTFTINLASTFIIRPMLKSFGEYWNNKKINELNKLITIIIGIIIIATIVVEIVCYTIGIPILQFIYSVELENYKLDLILLVLSGCFYAISNLMLYITTTIRKQGRATLAYFIVSIFSIFLSVYMVENMQMRGASISNIIISVVLTLMLIIIYVIEIFNIKQKEK